MKLDEGEQTDCPLFFGGINVYLQEKVGLFRRTPRWVDKLLDVKPLLAWSAKFQHMTRAKDLGELTVSMLQAENGRQAKELRRMLDWLKGQAPFDAVCLSNLLLAGMSRPLEMELGIPIICTMQGEDTFLDDLPEAYSTAAWALLKERCADCDAFIAVSRFYGGEMIRRLSLPQDRVHCVYNGILLDGYQPADSPPSPPCIGYLSRMCLPKGLHLLVDAFIELKQDAAYNDVRLLLVGSCTKGDETYLKKQKEKLQAAGVLDHVRIYPNVTREEKQQRLQEMTVLSVPACYGEAFGLYILEALASGVPVVQPRRGAFAELVNITGGGWIYDPNDEKGEKATDSEDAVRVNAQAKASADSRVESAALARCLAESLRDEDGRRKRAEQGRLAVLERFSITAMASAVAEVYDKAITAHKDQNV